MQDQRRRLFPSLSDAVEDVRAKLQSGTLTVTDRGLITGDWIPVAGLG